MTQATAQYADIEAHPVSLLDVVDRVLNKGAVITGELVISVANVDLIRISLRLLIASIEATMRAQCQNVTMADHRLL